MHPQGGRSREHGASLVEFALLVPVLFLILLGTITGGLTLSRQNSVENAVREGTRFGAVYPVDDGDASTTTDMRDYLLAVYEQTEAGATGDLDDGVPAKYICVAYIDKSDVKNKKEDDSMTAPVGDWCFDDGRSGEARVQVLARRTSDIRAILYSQTVTLKSQSVTRYER